MDDVNTQRLFITQTMFERDKQGRWCLSKVNSNHGKFAIGNVENQKLDFEIIERFMSYVTGEIKPILEDFLQQEELAVASEEEEDSERDTEEESNE